MAAQTLMEYDLPLLGSDGQPYRARACGRARADGQWEGWIEFESSASPEIVWRTARETTQPNRTDLMYWATGITTVFLEGALERAIKPAPQVTLKVPSAPAFEGPAPDLDVVVEDTAAAAAPVDAIVDPFFAYEKGEVFLRRQLGALDAWHLRNIAVAHQIVSARTTLEQLGKIELIELIVAHVRGLAAGSSAPSPH